MKKMPGLWKRYGRRYTGNLDSLGGLQNLAEYQDSRLAQFYLKIYFSDKNNFYRDPVAAEKYTEMLKAHSDQKDQSFDKHDLLEAIKTECQYALEAFAQGKYEDCLIYARYHLLLVEDADYDDISRELFKRMQEIWSGNCGFPLYKVRNELFQQMYFELEYFSDGFADLINELV